MDIYVQKDGQKHGPFSEDHIRCGIDAGEFTADDPAWIPGKASWQPLSALIGLDVTQSPPISNGGQNGISSQISQSTVVPSTEVLRKKNSLFSKHIISVSKAGDADCTTINEAVVVAPPGATIVIDEGIYEEAILITKPLILTGKEGKCVGVHHPSFDVLKIENTEVEINNINIGVAYAERSIALNQARLIMRRCRVKNAKDLVNDGIDYSRADAPSTALETDGRAQGGSLSANRVTSQRIDDNPQNASWIFEVRKNVDEAPICVDSRTALTLIDCELEYVFVVSKGGSIVFSKVFMHCCSVTALEHSNISVSECTTRSNRHNAAVFICDNSIIAIERTTLSQVYTTGVLCCNDAEVTFKDSKIEGIYQVRRDPCPKPPVVMPNKSEYEYPSGFVLSEKVQIVMDQATLTGLRCGVLITRTSTGHVVIRNSSISYNENGVLTGYSFSVFDDSKKTSLNRGLWIKN